MQEEWIVTLHNREDLEDFYNDMETPGGNLYIPYRTVDAANRRPISRNTHYMLTNEEAEELRNDPRVWAVDLKQLIDDTTRPAYTINADFDKSATEDTSDTNWGLLRHSEANNRSGWGVGGTTLKTDDLTITASGKNVDVVIVDGHIDPAHPEFTVNPDGTGASRVNQFNWFSLTNAVTGGSNGTYSYDRAGSYTNSIDEQDNNHGCHCAGTVAGNTQGWARDANIYNISPYGTNPNTVGSAVMWDYIRQWHNTKPINPETGRRNPTVTNNSYGSSVTPGVLPFADVKRVTYRGVDFNPGRDLTQAELQARGFYCPRADLVMRIPNYFASRDADIQDAMDDGIICCFAAGNDSWKTVAFGANDYDNDYQVSAYGIPYTFFLHRATGSGAGYAPTMNVGALSNNVTQDKAYFSNCGNQVDIFAAGMGIQSSLHSGEYQTGSNPDTFAPYLDDPRDSNYRRGKYQGTSMACPQVCGILTLLKEQWPNMTQTEANAWIFANAEINGMTDTGADDPMDRDSLQGAGNRIIRWINQRVESGNTVPNKKFRPRRASGTLYPRTRIRRRG